MTACPVLIELELTEDYDREHENAPVLSGGDYDISAIRSCGEECKVAAENRRLREALALIERQTRDYGVGIGARCNNIADAALSPRPKEAGDAPADIETAAGQ